VLYIHSAKYLESLYKLWVDNQISKIRKGIILFSIPRPTMDHNQKQHSSRQDYEYHQTYYETKESLSKELDWGIKEMSENSIIAWWHRETKEETIVKVNVTRKNFDLCSNFTRMDGFLWLRPTNCTLLNKSYYMTYTHV